MDRIERAIIWVDRNLPTVVILMLVIFLGVLLYFSKASNLGRDSTDPVGGVSGMNLYVDAATGCNYLGRSGGLTPRLRADGSHWCDLPAQKAQ